MDDLDDMLANDGKDQKPGDDDLDDLSADLEKPVNGEKQVEHAVTGEDDDLDDLKDLNADLEEPKEER